MLPLVTIMIPTYRQARFIADAVESALAQTYPNVEVVVADDASPDATGAVVARFASSGRLRYLRNSRNLGRVGNYRQTLFRAARGDWVLNLDGDDYFTHSDYIAEAMSLALDDPRAELVFGQAIYLTATEHFVMNRVGRHVQAWDATEFVTRAPVFGGGLGPIHSASIYRRATALRADFYRRDIISSDLESLYRIALHSTHPAGGRVIYLPRIAGVWRQHEHNVSRQVTVDQCLEDFALVDGIEADLRRHGTATDRQVRAWRRKALRDLTVSRAAVLIRSGAIDAVPAMIAGVATREPGFMAPFTAHVCARAVRYAGRRLARSVMRRRPLAARVAAE